MNRPDIEGYPAWPLTIALLSFTVVNGIMDE